MVSRGYRKLSETRDEENYQKYEDAVIKDLLSAFHVFDVQNKGYIESRDLREALGLTVTDIPSKELQQMLKEIGLLNDRKITFAEFSTLMTDRSVFEEERVTCRAEFREGVSVHATKTKSSHLCHRSGATASC